MSRYTYPHTIENGSGETLTFLRRVPGVRGERLEGTNVVKPGAGPPMHVHHRQEEGFTVVRGRLAYQRLGEPVQYAGAGESVVFRQGEPHRFWNAGTDDLQCTAYIEPADNLEYFLSEVFASQARAGTGRPALLDAAYLSHRFRSEFAMLVIPMPVQRLLFPVLIVVGTLLGRYTRYADAPVPIRP